MSTTITVAQVQQYEANIQMKYQQEGSMLRPLVRNEPTKAKFHYFDLLAPTAAIKNTARHADTPLVNSVHERRRAEMDDYDWADLIDDQDKVRIMIDPEGSYVMNAVNALGRSMDISLVTAFDADSVNGESGATTTAFPATQSIASVVMSVAVLAQAKRILDDNNVPQDDRHIVVAPQTIETLLGITSITSSDFNTVKALVQGDVDTFMGFKFHMIDPDLLPLSGTDRSLFVWHKRAMGLATGLDVKVDVSQRPDKRNATQVYVNATFGSVRIEDEGVVRIISDES